MGGAVLAFAIKAMFYFEQLRKLTHGGPLTIFLCVGILGAIAVAVIVGATLSRITKRWDSKKYVQEFP